MAGFIENWQLFEVPNNHPCTGGIFRDITTNYFEAGGYWRAYSCNLVRHKRRCRLVGMVFVCNCAGELFRCFNARLPGTARSYIDN